jgi:MFS family permease
MAGEYENACERFCNEQILTYQRPAVCGETGRSVWSETAAHDGPECFFYLYHHFRGHPSEFHGSSDRPKLTGQSLAPLCVVRALAGLGLAIASPATFGIIGTTFRHEPARTIAFSILSMGSPLGATTGPILGGAVAEGGGHRWKDVFYILAGLNLVPLVLGGLTVPWDGKSVSGRKTVKLSDIDWLGAGLVTTGMCIFVFSLTQSGVVEQGWRTPCESREMRDQPVLIG